MKKFVIGAVLILCVMFAGMGLSVGAAEVETTDEAVFLGIENYNTEKAKAADMKDFNYIFFSEGKEAIYKVSDDNDYAITNLLQEGYIYKLEVKNGTVIKAEPVDGDVTGRITKLDETSIWIGNTEIKTDENTNDYEILRKAGGASVSAEYEVKEGDTVKVFLNKEGPASNIFKTFTAEPYTAPVNGTPGVKTLKNFLQNAMEPVGTVLYVYGGGWDWQDAGMGNQATTIDIPSSWLDFFQSQDATYKYKDLENQAESYYPHQSYNEYNYAGVDCSGYVSWVLYNTINTQSSTKTEKNGTAVGSNSTGLAKKLAETQGWGTFTQDFDIPYNRADSDFKVGDIFSMNGHVWICLGTCKDGSIVIMHSTPSDSKEGYPGGGVQIGALNPRDTKTNCDAYKLANYYMTKYFPEWSSRYTAVLKDYATYTAMKPETNAGKFSWDLSGSKLLSDPDGYANMRPDELLKDLFGGAYEGAALSTAEGQPFIIEEPQPAEEPAATGGGIFADVKAEDWYASGVEFVFNKGLFNGTSATAFSPALTMNRAMAVTVLYRMSGQPEVTGECSFTDVKAGSYYEKAVIWGVESEIVQGYSAEAFAPDADITREQLVTLLYRYAEKKGMSLTATADLTTYSDYSAVSEYSVTAMSWACGAGLIQGSNNMLEPQGKASRAQTAVILMRFDKLN